MQEARNIYTEYLASAAATGSVEDDVWVTVDGGYVKVEEGEVVKTNNAYLVENAPTTGYTPMTQNDKTTFDETKLYIPTGGGE